MSITPNGQFMDQSGSVIVPEVIHSDNMGSLVRAEVDVQIATAKRYPRSVTRFRQETKELACIDQKTAESMFYSVPRAGKNIIGPSIRLAEIVMATWGNLRVECRIIGYQNKVVTVEAACWDIEKNSAVKIQKERKVHSKKTKEGAPLPPDQDMINLAINAALSIALRDAIFRVVPRAYVNEAFEEAKLVAIGKDKSIKDRRADCIEYAGKMGVSLQRLLHVADAKGIDDIGEEELVYIRGLFSGVKNGEYSVDDAFPEPTEATEKNLADAIKKPTKGKEPGKPKEDTKKTGKPGTEKTDKDNKEPQQNAENPEQPSEPVEPQKEPEPVKAEEKEKTGEGEVPDWVEKRKASYQHHTNVDRMRLPIRDMVVEWKKAEDDDKQHWEYLISDATTHLVNLCKKVSVVPLAIKLLEDALKGYTNAAMLVGWLEEKQQELSK